MSPCGRGWNGMNKIVGEPTTFKWTVNTFPVRLSAQDPNERMHILRAFKCKLEAIAAVNAKARLQMWRWCTGNERFHLTKISQSKKVSPIKIQHPRYCRHRGNKFVCPLYIAANSKDKIDCFSSTWNIFNHSTSAKRKSFFLILLPQNELMRG